MKAYVDKNLKPGEKLNIVAHSHGGNVVKDYSNMQGAQNISTLITLGTPNRSDYTMNMSKVGTFLNVYSAWDQVQSNGNAWWAGAGIMAAQSKAPAGYNVEISEVNGQRVGHSDLHTPEVLEQVPDFQGPP